MTHLLQPEVSAPYGHTDDHHVIPFFLPLPPSLFLRPFPLPPSLLPPSLTAEAESCVNVVDVCYSPELHGMTIVVANGRGAFITSQSARFEPHVWASI